MNAPARSSPPIIEHHAGGPFAARLLLSRPARPLRFGAVGAFCGLLQLVALIALKSTGAAPLPANVAAYLISAQVNFFLSSTFIWHDRRQNDFAAGTLVRQWAAFHGSIAGTFLLSQGVFVVSRLLIADVPAAALGILISGIANFLIQDRITFSAS